MIDMVHLDAMLPGSKHKDESSKHEYMDFVKVHNSQKKKPKSVNSQKIQPNKAVSHGTDK
jgi:hypothetical protein